MTNELNQKNGRMLKEVLRRAMQRVEQQGSDFACFHFDCYIEPTTGHAECVVSEVRIEFPTSVTEDEPI